MCRAYQVLGFDKATGGDEVFRDLVLARIIEPTSKIDSLRVLAETGIETVDYRTVTRHLPCSPNLLCAKPYRRHVPHMPGWGRPHWCSMTSARCTSKPMPVTGSVSRDSPRSAGWNRRSPSGCLTDASGFPLAVEAFEGNKAETATMLPVINAFKTAHQLTDVTVVADAGMISEANQIALQASGLSFILGTRIPFVPDVVREWRDKHPDEQIADGTVFTQPWPATSARRPAASRIGSSTTSTATTGPGAPCAASTNRSPKPNAPSTGTPRQTQPVHQAHRATKSVNRELEAKARGLAGLKGYTTNLTTVTPEFVIDAYHQLWRIEKTFRMSKHDLQARPVYHHKRESIDAHLTIVFAALAVSHWIEHQTGWSIKKFVRTARRYRTVQIKAGRQILTAADPLPDDLRDAIAKIDNHRQH